MNELQKNTLLTKLKEHIAHVQVRLTQAIENNRSTFTRSGEQMRGMERHDKMLYMSMKQTSEERIVEYAKLQQSPFFLKCELELEDSKKRVTAYIGKYSFVQEQIFSWVSPVAMVRFDQPGQVTYKLANGEERRATMLTKEQYLIVDGNVLFYATESLGQPRELVHQEHVARKTGFVLPEIVAQMERAQDAVIRAHHVGPLVISGPAGSGKTTLALHRVAYLAQSPDTAPWYSGGKTIVFVQDRGTQDYFAALLPELGITNTTFVTFSEWALQLLSLREYRFTTRYGDTELARDAYEFAKLQAMRSGTLPKFGKDPYETLHALYGKHLGVTEQELFRKQQAEKMLDRFDLTVLLMALVKTNKRFAMKYDLNLSRHGGKIKKKTETWEISYNLIVVDEFQNYLPEQLTLLKRCVEPERQTMLYVGDMGQQINLGTIRSWDEAGETITKERQVVLEKVYRNTKKILEYIGSLGYRVQIPAELREGVPVQEKIMATKQEEITYVREILEKQPEGSLGVLATVGTYLEEFKDVFSEDKRVHILTMAEAQGVEFETVCLVGIEQDMFSVEYARELPDEFRTTKQRIYKDLLYVALTRAMNELHVLGRVSLSGIVQR